MDEQQKEELLDKFTKEILNPPKKKVSGKKRMRTHKVGVGDRTYTLRKKSDGSVEYEGPRLKLKGSRGIAGQARPGEAPIRMVGSTGISAEKAAKLD